MEAQIKKQIDDLVEYTKAIKKMYDRIAVWDMTPEELSEEEQKEIASIIAIMNKVLDIEDEKIKAINVNGDNINAIHDYLVRFYNDIEFDDFLYENHIERSRVYNRLQKKLILGYLRNNVLIENKNIDYAICFAIENNYIYATDYEMRKNKEGELFSYLKQGRIFVSPFYDRGYYPECRVRQIMHYSRFRELMQNPTEEEIKKTALQFINEEYMGIIETFYTGFTNKAMEDPATFDRAMSNLMLMNACLITTLDPQYIDSSFLKFLQMKSEEKEYSRVNELIQGVLVRSKKQVLEYHTKKDDIL